MDEAWANRFYNIHEHTYCMYMHIVLYILAQM